MIPDLNTTISNKSDEDLLLISTHYKKYTKEALVIYLNEINKRGLEISNHADIENRIKELEQEAEKKNRIIEEKDLHPNIIRVSKLILVRIPISIVQLFVAAYYFYLQVDNSFITILLRTFSAAFFLNLVISYLFSQWIKKGTSTPRLVIGALTGYSILSQSVKLVNQEYAGVLEVCITILSLLINVYIVYLLFNKESNKWYKQYN